MTRNIDFSDGLASLRGIAATVVIIFHALLIFQIDSFDNPHRTPLNLDGGWLTATHFLLALFNGRAVVVLFFVLSGTVLAVSLARVGNLTWRPITAYYIRRALRLLPILCAVTLLSALMHHVYFDQRPLDNVTSWMNSFYKADPDWVDISMNVMGWSNSLNSPAWTIRIEIAASVVFPLLYFITTRDRVTVILGGFVLVGFMFAPGLSLKHTETFLLSFYLGALIPRLSPHFDYAYNRVGVVGRVMMALLTFTIMAGAERVHSPTSFHDPGSVLIVTLCSVALVAFVYSGGHTVLLKSRTLLFLGKISYSLYLIHFLVLFMLAHAVARSVNISPSPGDALVLNIGLAIATFALTVPLAALAYFGLERPCQRLGSRLSRIVLSSSEPRKLPWSLEAVMDCDLSQHNTNKSNTLEIDKRLR
jgi:peptidoglycan/LPS O-acetylase OafA/YrhL